MSGRDRFIVSNWSGLRCKFTVIKDKSEPKEIENDIRQQATNNQTPKSNIIADSDGLGAYIGGYIPGLKKFHGGSKAIRKQYANLKTECAYKLAEYINKGLIYIECDPGTRDIITEELEMCLKQSNVDKDDSKRRLIKKDEMKAMIGRSPDFLDVLIMRMYFEIKIKYRKPY